MIVCKKRGCAKYLSFLEARVRKEDGEEQFCELLLPFLFAERVRRATAGIRPASPSDPCFDTFSTLQELFLQVVCFRVQGALRPRLVPE